MAVSVKLGYQPNGYAIIAMEEVLPEGKNFRLVDESELPEIIEYLGNFLPDSIKPNNKLYESFSVFCPCSQLENLELLETEDILIDWSQPIYLNFTHADIMSKIEEFYANIGTIEKLYGDVYGLVEPNLEETEIELTIAEQGEMSQLKKGNAQIIHDLYPANQMECIEVFEKLIEKLPCFGVFSAQGDLAAWMVQSYYGAMFSMQTRPEYRRKGYGIILAKHLTKLVTDRGYLPFVVIRPENDASKGLYAKLGFKKHFETVRAILRPFEETGESQGGGGDETVIENGVGNTVREMNGDVESKEDQ
ncbi:hypothetical protein HUJ04_006883 [Dendroctonus ponderosae]|nr:hypothetical protein HUJ04_006883 [Dendroctonus ponderosae]